MTIDINERALIDYFLDPGKEDLHATFMKQHNVMYEDTAKISVIHEKYTNCPGFKIEIGNGNHYRDFDTILICMRSRIKQMISYRSIKNLYLPYGCCILQKCNRYKKVSVQ